MSKYKPLWDYIKSKNQEELKLSFDEIKNTLNFELDHSFLNFKKELSNYDFQVYKISMKEKFVIFKKINKEEK